MPWIGVDLDGTLARSDEKNYGATNIGAPIPEIELRLTLTLQGAQSMITIAELIHVDFRQRKKAEERETCPDDHSYLVQGRCPVCDQWEQECKVITAAQRERKAKRREE
ncbi:MAG: hypothetical protein ACYDHY_06895 [Acidiferrobacterales bacterium]